ncbi:hypothetical protein F5Y04DRAFT_139672 [Hypomontagnella monticulosa]|nr:hypothetical protein F5Y04DRAFT_139672 [Hypomontagnella monticulosa]
MVGVKASSGRDGLNEEEESLMAQHTATTEKWVPQTQSTGLLRILTWSRIYIAALHIAILGLLYLLVRSSRRDSISELLEKRTWSPVQQFVEYEVGHKHALNHDEYSDYSGPPTPEQNRAWDKLIRPVYFKATREELEKAGESMDNKVELEDGGYLANIGVYHELHCLRQLRFYLYRDVYYTNITEAQERYLHSHLDHCIETLRLTIMCHGNTGVYSFAWDDPTAPKPATQSNSKSVCVKWSSIETWSYSRMTSSDPLLRRPLD